MCQNRPVPPPPVHSMDCVMANGYKALAHHKQIAELTDFPKNLGARLASQSDEPFAEYIWQAFAEQKQPEQAEDILWLDWYNWWCHSKESPSIFYSGTLLSYLPPVLQGKARLRLFIELFDRYYAKQFGLDGGRTTDIKGRYVFYSYVEQAFDKEYRRATSVHHLHKESDLIEFIRGLGQRYPHLPSEVAQAFANPGVACWLSDQVENLNPHLVTIHDFDLDID